jgi:AbrB family looped-hinge helix DNA binding protein
MKSIQVTVSSKGQVVIPASIRERLGIQRGTRVSIRVDGGELILHPQSLQAELNRIRAMRGYTAGGPSGTEILLEDRRRERKREVKEEGW